MIEMRDAAEIVGTPLNGSPSYKRKIARKFSSLFSKYNKTVYKNPPTVKKTIPHSD